MRSLTTALATAAAAALLAATTVFLAPPGFAGSPGSISQLQSDLANCTGTTSAPFTETLTADLSDPSVFIQVNCVAILDLGSFNLTTGEFEVKRLQQLSIEGSSGSLTTNGALYTAGADLIIDGGTITANDSSGLSPGIVVEADPNVARFAGHLTVNGGTVVATGGSSAPGIGRVAQSPTSDSSSYTQTGGDVTATGGLTGAGVGGGNGSVGLIVSVSGGTLTAIPNGGSAVGEGKPLRNSTTIPAFGSLSVTGDGVVRLPSGSLIVPDSISSGPEVTLSGDGRITGSADGSTSATFTGSGQVQNDGTIDLPTSDVTGGGVTVSDRHYDVTFDPGAGAAADDTPGGPVTVYSNDFVDGDRPFPSDPTPPNGQVFVGWVAQGTDGQAHPLTATSDLSLFGDAPGTVDQDGLPVAAVASYRSTAPAPTLLLAGGHAVAAGSKHTFTGKTTPGAAVGLYAGSTRVASGKANAAGAFAIPVTIKTTATYAALAGGQVSAPIKVTAVKLTLTVPGPRPIKGGNHKLTGAAPAGKKVTLLVDGQNFDATTAKAGNTWSLVEDLEGTATFQILSDGVKSAAVRITAQPSAGSSGPGGHHAAHVSDPGGDVTYKSTAPRDDDAGPAPKITGVDVVDARIQIDERRVRLGTTYRGDVPFTGPNHSNQDIIGWGLTAGGQDYSVQWSGKGTALLLKGYDTVTCAGLQVVVKGNRSVFVIPRACLGRPSEVKGDSSTLWFRDAARKVFSDDTATTPTVRLES